MRRMHRSLWLALLLALVGSGAARAEDSISHAEIHFPGQGGIRDWRAEGNQAIYVESQNGQWYRATFASPCAGLQFRDTVAFVTTGPDRLDRFGSLLVGDGERCYFETFERVPNAPDASPED